MIVLSFFKTSKKKMVKNSLKVVRSVRYNRTCSLYEEKTIGNQRSKTIVKYR